MSTTPMSEAPLATARSAAEVDESGSPRVARQLTIRSSGSLGLAERGWLPDHVTRWGIRRLLREGIAERERGGIDARDGRFRALIDQLRRGPIALETRAANEQHYELPPEFFSLCLGPHRKYSGCYWPTGVTTLEDAEAASLRITCAHADLRDGQRILELGCGWGSLSLWIAERYPLAQITAVSNSAPQRRYIEQRCAERGLKNLRIITADMNEFAPEARFDRIVSVEMFEHMRNYETLLRRIANWLAPGGKLFVHVFVHGRTAYLFEDRGPADWLSRYFFTGGLMPSDDLLLHFQSALEVDARWRQSGEHYQKTSEAWLSNLDANRQAALAVLDGAYGREAGALWLQRWRLFFMACAEMFGYRGGTEWWVSHYRFSLR